MVDLRVQGTRDSCIDSLHRSRICQVDVRLQVWYATDSESVTFFVQYFSSDMLLFGCESAEIYFLCNTFFLICLSSSFPPVIHAFD